MLDSVLESVLQEIGVRYFKRKKKLKGPRLHVRPNGSVYVNVRDMLTSETGRDTLRKVHNSPFNKELVARQKQRPARSPIQLDEGC